jgi:hypothetical protein
MDDSGLIKVAPADAPRFDHRYVNGEIESLGLLVEESRINSISNNTMVGAVVGTPGSTPTNWGISTTNAELSSSIVGVGIESGISYIDIKVSGTVTASRACDILMQSPFISASNGQTWTHSVYLREVGGSQTNISDIRIQGNVYSDTQYITTPWFYAVPVTTEGLISQRKSVTATLSGETITRVGPFIKITTASSGVVDFTLRIGMPQLEAGSFMTSLIPTSGTPKTRNPDNVSMTGDNFSDWYNQSEGSIYCSVYNVGVTTTTSRFFYAIEDASAPSSDFIRQWIWNGNTSLLLNSFYTSNTTGQVNAISAEFSVSLEDVNKKISVGYAQSDFARSYNGSLTTDTSGNLPTGIDRLRIGTNLSGHISQLTYYPTRLTNAQLQNLTK